MKKKLFVGLLAVTMLAISVTPALAQRGELRSTVSGGLGNAANAVGWEDSTDLEQLIFNIINVVMGFLGLIAIIIILWGGFTWMTAGGNEDKVSTAKKMIISGVIGLAIVIGSYAISSWVVNTLVNVAAS